MNIGNVFRATPNTANVAGTQENVGDILNVLPWYLATIIKPLANVVLKYILNIDENYDVDVADSQISDGVYVSLLTSIGTKFEHFKKSDLVDYLSTKEQKFNRKVWSPGDINSLVGDIVAFCADIEDGRINTNALKKILSGALKDEITCASSSISSKQIVPLFSERKQTCGVIRIELTGEKIEISSACCSGSEIDLNIKRVGLMFHNTHDLLHTMRTFVATCQK